MPEKIIIRKSRFWDVIGIERVVIWAKQPRIAKKLVRSKLRSSILLGIALMRRVNHAIDYLGANAMGQKYRFLTIVAESDGQIVGACTINTALGRDPYVWFLGPIAVSLNDRKKGIGTLLLNEALRYVKRYGGKSMFLSVSGDNTAAIALYKKCGFKSTAADISMVYDF
tara:strand:- start:169 stop:675 length:507 start_codon:yes stop_codon:yes gene_type:complete